MYYLSKALFFPPVSHADSDGILAFGGDLSPERLQLAYKSGIFPWFNEGEPIIWWSPNPRTVLFLDELIVSKSMRNILNRNHFTVTFNQNFRDVISNCQQVKRDGQSGTWITNEMIEAYCKLNELGIAKSLVSNASKVAFIALASQLKKDNYRLLDCQVYNEHLESLGCREIEREAFMAILKSK
jgi:leucyl/phenylalanyl-tRNA--protein transferase